MLELLQEALQLAQKMTTHAKQDEWQNVALLQERYAALINLATTQPAPTADEAALARRLIMQLKETEALITAPAQKRKDEAANALREYTQAQQAINAYQQLRRY